MKLLITFTALPDELVKLRATARTHLAPLRFGEPSLVSAKKSAQLMYHCARAKCLSLDLVEF